MILYVGKAKHFKSFLNKFKEEKMETVNSKDKAQELLRINTLLELRNLLAKLDEVRNDIEILLMNGGLECKL